MWLIDDRLLVTPEMTVVTVGRLHLFEQKVGGCLAGDVELRATVLAKQTPRDLR